MKQNVEPITLIARFYFMLAAAILMSSATLVGQESEWCGTHQHLLDQIRQDPHLADRMERYEAQMAVSKQGEMVQSETVYTIPIVFHVIYKNADQNVSDARLTEQIAVLNRDFAGMNANTMGAFSPTLKADVKIQFCLAKTAPDGSSTTGIERRQTTIDNFHNYQTHIKRYETGGLDAWDPNVYFNIWVCATDGLSFGTFPGTGVTDQFGAVVHHDWIVGGDGRRSSSGKVASHEVGHCLNLRHTWGDDNGACTGTDYVDDTPNLEDHSQSYWIGTSTEPGETITDNCSSSSPGIMYMNIMDYNYDHVYANFTPGQKSRMRVNLASGGALVSLASSFAVNTPSSCTTPTGLRAVAVQRSKATLMWTDMQNAESYNVRYRKQGATSWTSGTSTSPSLTILGLSKNTNYEFQVQMVGSSCTSDYSYSLNFRTPFNDPASSLSTPTLDYPADGATNTGIVTTLGWNTVSGVEEYVCQFSTSSSFTESVNMVGSSSSRNRNAYDLMYGTTYYWRVMARNGVAESNWSETRSFTVTNGTVGTPQQSEPANGATNASTKQWLQWSGTSDATGFIVQVSESSDMSDPSEKYRDITGTMPEGLQAGTTYYWRVKGVRGSLSGSWSETWSFTTADSTLQPPVPSLPGHYSIENPASLNLVWKPEASATSYSGEYGTSSSLTGATSFTTSDTSFSISGLTGSTTYYWRIRSVNGSGSSDWSSTRHFTTVGTATALDAPSLSSPSNNSTNVSKSPTLSWSSVANATGYVVQYSTSSSMSPNTEATTSSTSYGLAGLASNTTYYWRVKATASGIADSDWSSVWNFKTAKGGKGAGNEVEDGEIVARRSVQVSIFPSPFTSQATIGVTLDRPDVIRVVVVNMIGQEQVVVFEGRADEGVHHFDLLAGSMGSGLYYCQVITSTSAVSTAFSVLK